MKNLPQHLAVAREHIADMAQASNEAEWRRCLANLVAGLILNAPTAPLGNPDLHLLVHEAESAIKAGPPHGARRSVLAERRAVDLIRGAGLRTIPEAARILSMMLGITPEAARKRAVALDARYRLRLSRGQPYGGKKPPRLSADERRARVTTE